jgi:hypothetical protein
MRSLLNRMKIQLISDLHLEYLGTSQFERLITPSAPILIMAGDISTHNYKYLSSFLQWVSQHFETTLWILGNHEYYDRTQMMTMPMIGSKLRRMCPSNVHLLDNQSIDLGGVAFIGTTLWSQLPDRSKPIVEKSINDYHSIYVHPQQLIMVDETNQLHQKVVAYLKQELSKVTSSQDVVTSSQDVVTSSQDVVTSSQDVVTSSQDVIITHHVPCTKGTSDPQYEVNSNRLINSAFATDLILQNDPKQTITWCCGHTHHNFSFPQHIHGYHLYSNQFGYEGEHTGISYCPDYTIDLDDK